MVEPITITAVALLAAYLKGATEEAGKRTGGELADGVKNGCVAFMT